MPNGIEHEGRYTQVGTFPIGIDPMQFVDGIREEKVVKRLEQMKARFKGCKVSPRFCCPCIEWSVLGCAGGHFFRRGFLQAMGQLDRVDERPYRIGQS